MTKRCSSGFRRVKGECVRKIDNGHTESILIPSMDRDAYYLGENTELNDTVQEVMRRKGYVWHPSQKMFLPAKNVEVVR